MIRALSVFVLWVALLLALAPLRASAQDLDAARAAYLDADFERARTLYRAVLESEDLDRAQAIEALRYLVALDTLLGDTEAARGHARSAVALEPSVTVPEGSPDEAAELVERARVDASREATAALDLAPAEPPASGVPTTIVLSYPGGPRSLIDELRLHCDGAQGAHDATGEMPEVRLATPETAGDLACTGEARTRAGAVLARASEVFARSMDGQSTVPVPQAENDWGLILGVTGAVLAVVVAAVIVGVVLGTSSSAPSFGPTQVCGPGWASC
jgi:hypothetical protein